ncbi:SMC family ATPase [Microbacterium sp. BWT-B31]|uniref:AAA family ATPase n=1 Tax=Microbacterium sp. BWT-B31 TaxID=3232072 RepID=UPI0035286A0E
MRLHSLELEGFGPFRDRQVVDFDGFRQDGIFLIAGRTGAGKSSVLDGVCFALYGGVPRYESGDRRLRSDYCAPDEPTSATVVFSVGEQRWRVTRSPEYERAKKRGVGTTPVAADAQLDEFVDGAWVGRAAGLRNVGLALDDVLGLTQQQFLQVILLAQNRFAEFLLAKSDERQKLLRRLFGTRTFEQYQEALEQRRKDAQAAIEAAGDGASLLLDEAERLLDSAQQWEGFGEAGEVLDRIDAASDAEGSADDLAARVARAEHGVRTAHARAGALREQSAAATAAARSAESALAAASWLHEKLQQLEKSRSRLAALEAASPSIESDRLVVERADAAEALRAPLDAAERAAAAAAVAASEREARRAAWTKAGGEHDADATALRGIADELTGQLARWAGAEGRERELAALAAQIARNQQRAEALEHEVREIDERRAALAARLAGLEPDLRAALGDAGRLGDAQARLASAAERLAAAREAEALATDVAAAEAAQLAAAQTHDRARAEVTDLLTRRLAGYAGELAGGLVDGIPCAVCGSTDHPDPAVTEGAVVTDDEIARAEAVRDEQAATEKAAAQRAAHVRSAHAGALARAGGESVATLEVQHHEAAAEVRAARDADARRATLTEERDALVAADAEAADQRGRAATALADLRVVLAVAKTDAATLERAVAEARGSFASVAERVAESTRRRALAGSFADAIFASSAADKAAVQALADVDQLLAASAFEDRAQASAALRAPDVRAALRRRVGDHEVALRTETEHARRLEHEIGEAASGLEDLASATASRDTALASERQAVEACTRAEQTAQQVSDLVRRAAAAHEGIAALAADRDVIARLANTVSGRAPNTHRMTLEAFVLAAELEVIVDAANLRLEDMSNGRYRLQHSDARAARNAASGLGLEIMDAHTGQSRPAQSLSGGETFLASLALALGLAEVVTARAGGIRLDTLFIDEGFGSLDDETLELAMRALDELRQGGRTVGLISHVAAMKEQIPAQLVIEATAAGPSIIRQASVDVAAGSA